MSLPCGCNELGYRSGMNFDELSTLLRSKRSCSDPLFLCPNLDRLLRRAGAERTRQNYYSKKRKREGGEINIKPKRSHQRMEEVDINVLLSA